MVALPRLLHLLGSRGIPSFVFSLMVVLNARAAAHDAAAAQTVFHLAGVVLWAMFLVLVNVRPVPVRRGRAPIGVVAALGSQFTFIAIGVLASSSASGARVWIADVLLLGGVTFAVLSVAVLGRCFGVLPDVRGLVTRGPYRWVRHPLYLGELVSALGLVAGAKQPLLPAAAWALCLAVQLVRAYYEEQGLAAEFPEYADYARRTARLIPGLV